MPTKPAGLHLRVTARQTTERNDQAPLIDNPVPRRMLTDEAVHISDDMWENDFAGR
jgi:hypothetical protein